MGKVKEFIPDQVSKGAKKELLEINIEDYYISFMVLKKLRYGKQEILDFFKENLNGK